MASNVPITNRSSYAVDAIADALDALAHVVPGAGDVALHCL